MPRHRLQKMLGQLFGPCKSTDTSGPSKVRELSYGPCKILEKRSGRSKMHGYRSRPHKTSEHRTSLCKIPRHRRSCKPSVGAIRPSRTRLCPSLNGALAAVPSDRPSCILHLGGSQGSTIRLVPPGLLWATRRRFDPSSSPSSEKFRRSWLKSGLRGVSPSNDKQTYEVESVRGLISK